VRRGTTRRLAGPALRVAYLLDRARRRLFRPVTAGVRVVVVDQTRVLLVRHSYRPGWHLPGGALRRGETFEEAARRETLEETGLLVRELRLLGVFTSFEDGGPDHITLFACERFEGRARAAGAEIAEVSWFDLAALPGDMPSSTRRRLAEFSAGALPSGGRW
jgi:ADP-ribose pyrophosphatase YjhB (NUDIX family)